mmetsp:Transcript_71796/g.191498  ORF Transcript_71796/g.191498 Transcript_71796/m.191498 type:complete len:553 (-) Transcript_71796:171-1829(-)
MSYPTTAYVDGSVPRLAYPGQTVTTRIYTVAPPQYVTAGAHTTMMAAPCGVGMMAAPMGTPATVMAASGGATSGMAAPAGAPAGTLAASLAGHTAVMSPSSAYVSPLTSSVAAASGGARTTAVHTVPPCHQREEITAGAVAPELQMASPANQSQSGGPAQNWIPKPRVKRREAEPPNQVEVLQIPEPSVSSMQSQVMDASRSQELVCGSLLCTDGQVLPAGFAIKQQQYPQSVCESLYDEVFVPAPRSREPTSLEGSVEEDQSDMGDGADGEVGELVAGTSGAAVVLDQRGDRLDLKAAQAALVQPKLMQDTSTRLFVAHDGNQNQELEAEELWALLTEVHGNLGLRPAERGDLNVILQRLGSRGRTSLTMPDYEAALPHIIRAATIEGCRTRQDDVFRCLRDRQLDQIYQITIDVCSAVNLPVQGQVDPKVNLRLRDVGGSTVAGAPIGQTRRCKGGNQCPSWMERFVFRRPVRWIRGATRPVVEMKVLADRVFTMSKFICKTELDLQIFEGSAWEGQVACWSSKLPLEKVPLPDRNAGFLSIKMSWAVVA